MEGAQDTDGSNDTEGRSLGLKVSEGERLGAIEKVGKLVGGTLGRSVGLSLAKALGLKDGMAVGEVGESVGEDVASSSTVGNKDSKVPTPMSSSSTTCA